MNGETLDPTERRILGVLVEKALTTPESYPLTVNALVTGCNQKSNREPVTAYQDFEVEGALRSLFLKKLVTNTNAHGRLLKWRHRLDEVMGLEVPEQAVLAELLLRGPQQPGELRSRAHRMSSALDGIESLSGVLERLEHKHPPLVCCLGRRAGERADRYGHTLAPSDEVAPQVAEPPVERPAPREPLALEARVAALEEQVRKLWAALRGEASEDSES